MKNKSLIHRNYSIFLFFFLIIQTGILLAIEEPERKSGEDAGLATVWMITQVSQGGYLRPALNFTAFDSKANLMWEIEAGWRFTNWFKFGAGLKRTFIELDSVQNHVTTFGLVAGASGKNPLLGYFTFDLSVGSLDTGDLDNAQYYIEPGFHIRRHLYKRVFWTVGLTYRYVDNESVSILGKNSLNSLSVKLTIVNSKY